MKEIVLLSGKGGTGKTTIAASFASLANSKVLVDCDVDAADLRLILQPTSQEDFEFWSGKTAHIHTDKCNKCGLCQKHCRFEAIKDYQVDPTSCEGCGFCSYVCPTQAITMEESLSGYWFIANTTNGYLVHARLGIAQENSGKLVATVRKEARHIAEKYNLDFIISDGPPGIGCPVISSLSGTDLAVLITEPTLTGIHDLKRVLNVCRHFGVSALVCINKYDINPDNTRDIENYCREEEVRIAAKIPFDHVVTESMIKGVSVIDFGESPVSREIEHLWTEVCEVLASK